MTNAQDTTAARAEAQDEGAAGKRKSLIERLRNIDNGTVRERPWIATELCDEAANALEAHPSPPPAADEDRVRLLMKSRSAIEAGLATLTSLGATQGGRVSLMRQTSAEITEALKSEGK